MKKILLAALMALFTITTIWAAWTKNDVLIPMDEDSSNKQVQIQSCVTPEGKTVVSWLRDVGADEEHSKYVLHLQLFDEQGVAQFGEQGVLVSDHDTRSWTNPYVLYLASNGDILLGYNDIRAAVEKKTPTMYIYRYNQKGEPVWSADGISFPAIQFEDDAIVVEQENVKICQSGDNLYVAVCDVENLKGDDSGIVGGDNTYKYHWQVHRLDAATGKSLTTDPLVIHSVVLNLMPAPNGDVYAIYDNEYGGQGMHAQRYDADLLKVWSKPTLVEEESLYMNIVPEPLLATAQDGGVLISYRKFNDMTGYQVVQHLSPNGEVLPSAVMTNGTDEGNCSDAKMATHDGSCLIAYNYTDVKRQDYLYVNRLSDNGDYLWTDYNKYGIGLASSQSRSYYVLGIVPQTDGFVLFTVEDEMNMFYNFKATKIAYDGTVAWEKYIHEGQVNLSAFSVAHWGTQAYMFVTLSDGMYRMSLSLTKSDATALKDSISTPTSIRSAEIYTVDGKRISAPVQGINILRLTDENGNVTTKKIIQQ